MTAWAVFPAAPTTRAAAARAGPKGLGVVPAGMVPAGVVLADAVPAMVLVMLSPWCLRRSSAGRETVPRRVSWAHGSGVLTSVGQPVASMPDRV